MQKTQSQEEEGNDRESIEAIFQIINVSLGEGAAMCQVCGSEVREGARVVAYAFQPAGSPAFEIGHVLCDDHLNDRFEEYTIGVREIVVAGRVGSCGDVASQSWWPVLLVAEVLAVSEMESKSLVKVESREERSTDLQATASACGGGR